MIKGTVETEKRSVRTTPRPARLRYCGAEKTP